MNDDLEEALIDIRQAKGFLDRLHTEDGSHPSHWPEDLTSSQCAILACAYRALK